jgi:hypothetical protein
LQNHENLLDSRLLIQETLAELSWSREMNESEKQAQTQVLLEISKFHREELGRHEKLAADIYQWTCTLLIAILGAELAWYGTDASKSFNPRWPVPLVVSLASCGLAALASREISKRRSAYDANARIIAKAALLLKLFSKYTFETGEIQLYPDHWKNWGDRNFPATESSPNSMIAILAILSLSSCILSIYLGCFRNPA